MRRWGRALLVPVIALVLWTLPGGDGSVVTGDVGPSALASIAQAEAVSQNGAVDQNKAELLSSDEPSMQSPGDGLPTTTAAAPPSTNAPTERASETIVAPTSSSTSTTAESTQSDTAVEELTMGDQALARMSYPWREVFPDWTIVFRGPRTGLRGLTFPSEKRIEVFIRSDDTVASLHRVVAHEIGHAVDVELNSESDRKRWREQRDLPASTPWWPSASSPDFATGAGDFAEAFAVWETSVTTRSTVASQPTGDDLALLAELSQG